MTDTDILIAPTTDELVLGEVYDTVLAPSFPTTELVPRDEFIRDGAAGRLDVLVARNQGHLAGTIVGARHGAVVLVVWLAAGPAGRGGGVGSALFDAGVVRWRAVPDVCMVLGEIERPDAVSAEAAHGDPARRLQFYARRGVGALTMPYYQPPVGPGMPRVRGMLLTVFASADASLPRALHPRETSAVRQFLLETMGTAADDETRDVFAAVDAGLQLVPLL